MAKGNGKRSNIDLEQLAVFMRLKPTLNDTAAFFKCGKTTIEDTIRTHFNLTFREFRDQNMVHTRMDLIREAIRRAKGGSDRMLIFCLKNLCDWADKQEITGKDGQSLIDTSEIKEMTGLVSTMLKDKA